MSAPREEGPGTGGPLRRFFLEVCPDQGEPRLAPDEARHAATVLRMRAGDRILGLDGRGHAWPLTIRGVTRASLEVTAEGPPETETGPGAPGAAVPDLCLAFSMPQANRLEALVDRLTQIGVARIAPFVAAHTPVRSRTLGARAGERLTKIARAACKQSRRLWEPVLEPLRPLAQVVEASRDTTGAILDPHAQAGLASWCADRGRDGTPSLTLFVGPEGGFAAVNLAVFAGAAQTFTPVRVAPYVLRIETAAELSAGLVIHDWQNGS